MQIRIKGDHSTFYHSPALPSNRRHATLRSIHTAAPVAQAVSQEVDELSNGGGNLDNIWQNVTPYKEDLVVLEKSKNLALPGGLAEKEIWKVRGCEWSTFFENST